MSICIVSETSTDKQAKTEQVHPASNTGAQNTEQNNREQRILIDWLSGTCPVEVSLEETLEIFGLKLEDVEPMPHGMNGYKSQYRYGDAIFLADGREDMGVHFSFTGNGCRELEQRIKGDWIGLATFLCDLGVNFTRTDGAIDDFSGLLDIELMRKKIQRGECLSYFDDIYEMTKYSLKASRQKHAAILKKQANNLPLSWEDQEYVNNLTGVHTGRTLYFGSAKSRVRVRFYDKLAQMKVKIDYEKGKIENGSKQADPQFLEKLEQEIRGVDQWTRAEIQMRGARANAFWGAVVAQVKTVGEILSGSLLHYIRFVDVNMEDLDNASRWDTSVFWSEFIGNVSRHRLTLGKSLRSVEKIVTWLEKFIATSIGIYFEANGRDPQALVNLAELGVSKFKEKDRAVLSPTYYEEERARERAKMTGWKKEWDLRQILNEHASEDKKADLVHMSYVQLLRETQMTIRNSPEEKAREIQSSIAMNELLKTEDLFCDDVGIVSAGK